MVRVLVLRGPEGTVRYPISKITEADLPAKRCLYIEEKGDGTFHVFYSKKIMEHLNTLDEIRIERWSDGNGNT